MALQGKVRLYQVRRGDSLNDQRSSVEIQNAPNAAGDQDQFQDALLSQVKRILWGDNPGRWYDDFLGSGLKSLSALAAQTSAGGQVFQAVCTATDTVGTLVRVSGDDVNGVSQVTAVDVTDASKVPCIGILVAKSDATHCTVVRDGRVDLSAVIQAPLTAGKRYFVGYNGKPVATPPSAYSSPSGYAMVQAIGVATSGTHLEFRPDFFLIKTDTQGKPPIP